MPKSANLPSPPSVWKSIGPSFILLGLALGSGELILWPFLAANWGLGLIWGALLGISFQYILNTETMRYTLARGESVFLGMRHLSWWIPIWFVFSTFVPWSLPGFSSAASQIFSHLFPFMSERFLAVFLLLLTGTILSLGKVLYRTMEIFQKTVILLGLPFIIFLTILITKSNDWLAFGWGLVGRGNGYWFLPQGVALASFLGAFAYSGAGGNLNLAQSYYIKEKGFGMGKYTAKITSLFSKQTKAVKLDGDLFTHTAANQRKWQAWWRLINIEHFLVFWVLGFVTIAVLAVLSRATVYGQQVSQGLSFLYTESGVIASRTHSVFGVGFLLAAGLMLFSTQVGVLESSSRIISENVLLLFYKKGKKYNASLWFYVALWGQIMLGILIYLAGFQEPRLLLTIGAGLNAMAMMMAFLLISWLNRRRLPKYLQASTWRQAVMFIAFLFFLFFVWITLQEMKLF